MVSQLEIYQARKRITSMRVDEQTYVVIHNDQAKISSSLSEIAGYTTQIILETRHKVRHEGLGRFPTAEQLDQFAQCDLSRINYEGHRGMLIRHLDETEEMPNRFILLSLKHLNSDDRQKFEDELLEALQDK